jgi:hypothetical protein
MGKLIVVICAASAAAAAPAWAVGSDTPQVQQVYLRETQQVTARAQLIYKLADNDTAAGNTAVEGQAEVVEHSQGLVVYDPATDPAASASLQAHAASPVRTTTTATVHWAPVPVLPTPRSF